MSQSTDVTLSLWDKAPYFFINGNLPQSAIDAIDDELSYEVPDAQWTEAWRSGDWDGLHRLLRKSSNGSYYFPVGVLQHATVVLDTFDVDYEIKGLVRPGRGDLDVRWDTEKTPRGYQQDAIDDCLRHGSGLVVLPTAGGKTFIGIRLIYELRRPTIVFAHRQEIADQWVEEIQNILGIDPAICYGGTRENGDVMVALYQSVYDAEEKEVREDVRLDHDVALFDEAHRVAADTFSRVSLSCNAVYRYGFTATPEREDNATLRVLGGTGPVISDLSAEALIDKGYLAEPEWELYESRRSGGQHRTWQAEYQEEIVENGRRNGIIADVVEDLERPTMVTVERINHGERLGALIDGSKFVHGSSSDREETLDAFRDGDVPILIATRGLVGEGFDVPEIASFVVAGGLKSSTSMIQQVGRSLRPETKTATIVDFFDKGRWVSKHSEERLRTYQSYYGSHGP